MNKRDIIILVAVMAYVAIRLYQRYKKKSNSTPSDTQNTSTSGFPSSSKDDDYEPYSKK